MITHTEITLQGCIARETHTKFNPENIKERGYLENVDVEGMIILKLILKTQGLKMWTEFISFNIKFKTWKHAKNGDGLRSALGGRRGKCRNQFLKRTGHTNHN
jgi:hypothetical protein